MKLSELVEINVGLLFRRQIESSDLGRYAVVQSSNITSKGEILWPMLASVDLATVKPDVLIHRNEILVKARGLPHVAAFVDERREDTLASSHFLILRVKRDEVVLPAFLAWYLNQKPAQRYLDRISAGTGTKILNRTNMARMPITLPDLNTQSRVIELYRLGQQEEQLTKQIGRLRQKLFENVMVRVVAAPNTKA